MINQTGLFYQFEEPIFKNREVFTLNYTPEVLNFRDLQIKEMILSSMSLQDNIAPDNMFLYGGFGTGKTTIVNKFFELIREQFSNVICAHVNCKFYNTEFKVLSQIYEEVFNKTSKHVGKSSFIIQKEIMNEIIKQGKVLMVCLDDV